MLPAPTTIATSTPWSRTAVTWRATAFTRSGSVPKSSCPINASPDSFSRMRLKAGAIPGEPIPQVLLADCKAGEAADHHVLTGGGGQLVAQLLDRLSLELRVVHLLLEQHHRAVPRIELAGDDPLAHVLGLLGRFLLVDAGLGVAHIGGHILPADVGDRGGGGDLHGDRTREADEVLVRGDEVSVAVDLDQHPHASSSVDVGLDRALGGGAFPEILDLLALLQAQDLDRLLHVAIGLGQRLLAVHHARAGALAQRLDVLGGDIGGAHQRPGSPAGSLAGCACWDSASPAAGPPP